MIKLSKRFTKSPGPIQLCNYCTQGPALLIAAVFSLFSEQGISPDELKDELPERQPRYPFYPVIGGDRFKHVLELCTGLWLLPLAHLLPASIPCY